MARGSVGRSVDEMMFDMLQRKKRDTSLILNGKTADLNCANGGSISEKRSAGDELGETATASEATTQKKTPKKRARKAGEQTSNEVETEKGQKRNKKGQKRETE